MRSYQYYYLLFNLDNKAHIYDLQYDKEWARVKLTRSTIMHLLE